MNMETRTGRGGWGMEDRGRAASWTRKSLRGMDIRRHWFKAVNRDSVLAVAELECEKGGRAGNDSVRRTIIGWREWQTSGITANINLGGMTKRCGNGRRVNWRRGQVVRGDWLESWCCGETVEGRNVCGHRRRLVVRKKLRGKSKVSTVEGLGR